MITADDLRDWPVEQKIQLIRELWGQVADDDRIPIPTGVVDEARRRIDELKRDPSVGLTLDELWRRVDATD